MTLYRGKPCIDHYAVLKHYLELQSKCKEDYAADGLTLEQLLRVEPNHKKAHEPAKKRRDPR